MSKLNRFSIFITVFTLLLISISLTIVSAHNTVHVVNKPVSYQSDAQLEQIKQIFRGKVISMSWRKGGAMYGTYFSKEVSFCSTSQYVLSGHSEKGTVLNNTQFHNWREQGTWDVVRYQGYIYLIFQPVNGDSYSFNLEILSNGRLSIHGVSAQVKSAAQC